ncbi:MAG: hypothetical protein WAO76_11610, partial [Georgfuchsia sp.]
MNIRKVAMNYLALFLVILAPAATAESAGTLHFCNRLPFDEEVPAGLIGSYDIVGKNAATGSTYSGTLQVNPGKNSY